MPFWFTLAFGASLCAAAGNHTHQRLKGGSAASALWMKMIALAVAVPLVAGTGLPVQPLFYVFAAAAALCWCCNDLMYFRAVSDHGAALVSRLMPFGILISFVLWFAIDHALLERYLGMPLRFAEIGLVLAFAVACAVALHRCPTSSRTLRAIWPMLATSVAGTLAMKKAVDLVPKTEGVFGYVGIDAALTLSFYLLYFGLRDRKTLRAVYTVPGIKTGFPVGLLLTGAVVLRIAAQQRVDNPAYVSTVDMLDVVWLMMLSRLSGWTDDSNKWAGLGIALSALMLAALKIR
jgi:hypothetical protein